MTDLLAARIQMTLSLGFRIAFAEIGIAIPLLMVVAEWGWRRRSDALRLDLARRCANGPAVLFAVGTASGTVLSSLRFRERVWKYRTGQRGSQLILGR